MVGIDQNILGKLTENSLLTYINFDVTLGRVLTKSPDCHGINVNLWIKRMVNSVNVHHG